MANDTINFTSLQPLLFDFTQYSGFCGLHINEKEAQFASLWNLILDMLPDSMFTSNFRGRTGYSLVNILAVRVVMLFFKQNNIKQALSFLSSNPCLKEILGMTKCPSQSVISRRTKEVSEILDVLKIHELVVREFHKEKLICNLSIDSTPIDARETPVKKVKNNEPKKRGRKKEGSQEKKEYQELLEKKEELEREAKFGDIKKYLARLENRCSITGKKNSKGHMQWRIGYKVHLAVDDFGIPVSFFVTGASVHDSQVAIPLLRTSMDNAKFFYALMDGGYSSGSIADYTCHIGAVPLIDFKANRKGEKKDMDPAKKIRYRARTTVERTNSELKDTLLPPKLYSRGDYSKFDLELSVLLLTLKKIRVVEEKIERNSLLKVA